MSTEITLFIYYYFILLKLLITVIHTVNYRNLSEINSNERWWQRWKGAELRQELVLSPYVQ